MMTAERLEAAHRRAKAGLDSLLCWQGALEKIGHGAFEKLRPPETVEQIAVDVIETAKALGAEFEDGQLEAVLRRPGNMAHRLAGVSATTFHGLVLALAVEHARLIRVNLDDPDAESIGHQLSKAAWDAAENHRAGRRTLFNFWDFALRSSEIPQLQADLRAEYLDGLRAIGPISLEAALAEARSIATECVEMDPRNVSTGAKKWGRRLTRILSGERGRPAIAALASEATEDVRDDAVGLLKELANLHFALGHHPGEKKLAKTNFEACPNHASRIIQYVTVIEGAIRGKPEEIAPAAPVYQAVSAPSGERKPAQNRRRRPTKNAPGPPPRNFQIIAAALARLHKLDGDLCDEPVTRTALAREAMVDASAVTRFFEKLSEGFTARDGYAEYRRVCNGRAALAKFLRGLTAPISAKDADKIATMDSLRGRHDLRSSLGMEDDD